MKLILFVFSLLFFSPLAAADEVTHQLGNSGYAIRWAMDEGAAKKSPEHYWRAVELQGQAKAKLAAENEKEALRLSREAEKEAKLALKESMNK